MVAYISFPTAEILQDHRQGRIRIVRQYKRALSKFAARLIVTLSTRTPVYFAITEKECCHCCIQQLFRNQKFYWRTKEDNLRKASLEHNSFNSALPYRSVVGKHPFLEGKVSSFFP